MQSTRRCPRCGYVLTYNGSAYHCDFCGYPRTQETLAPVLHSIEKKVSDGIQRVITGLRPRMTPQPSYYPVNVIMQPCINCGFNFPKMAPICPSCGTQRATITQPPPTVSVSGTYELDRKIFDYISIHEGTISLSQAAQDLATTQAALLTSIERLKAGGFLSQS